MIADKKIRRAAVYEHFLRWHITDDQNRRPPYVIVASIDIEITEFGDAFISCQVVQTDGSVTKERTNYTRPMIDNLLDPSRLTRLEERLGLATGYCAEYNLFMDIDPDDDERIAELFIQRREDCYGIIRVWEESIDWRFKVHKIRCDECANKIMRRGYNAYDAYYVE